MGEKEIGKEKSGVERSKSDKGGGKKKLWVKKLEKIHNKEQILNKYVQKKCKS